jgi:hypothetical protein
LICWVPNTKREVELAAVIETCLADGLTAIKKACFLRRLTLFWGFKSF